MLEWHLVTCIHNKAPEELDGRCGVVKEGATVGKCWDVYL